MHIHAIHNANAYAYDDDLQQNTLFFFFYYFDIHANYY